MINHFAVVRGRRPTYNFRVIWSRCFLSPSLPITLPGHILSPRNLFGIKYIVLDDNFFWLFLIEPITCLPHAVPVIFLDPFPI